MHTNNDDYFTRGIFLSALLSIFLFVPVGYALDSVSSEALQTDIYPVYPDIDYGTGKEATIVKRGEYLAKVGDCIACHTDSPKRGKSFAGGLPLETPFGDFYSPNLTPDKETGLGEWKEEDFIRAMREGKAPDGSNYFPVFPYLYFNRMHDDDLRAIWAYLKKIPPVKQKNRKPGAPFPFSWRFAQYGWKLLFFYPHKGQLEYNPDESSAWNRGRYIVEGAGHCAMCHTPVNMLGAPKRKYHLTGAFVDGYWAPNVTGYGLQDLTEQQIAKIFASGERPRSEGRIQGPMAEVNHNSLMQLTYKDQLAIAAYLKSVKSDQPLGPQPITKPMNLELGKKIYYSACHICHQNGAAGAPMVGAEANWNNRAKQGLNTLYSHTINGYNLMPPMGACVTCTHDDIKAAVDYLLNVSLNREQFRELVQPDRKKRTVALDGQQVYERYCASCHDKGDDVTPKIGDKKVWEPIIKQNVDVILYNVLKGKHKRITHQHCDNCTDKEVIDATKYIIEKSKTEGDYSLW